MFLLKNGTGEDAVFLKLPPGHIESVRLPEDATVFVRHSDATRIRRLVLADQTVREKCSSIVGHEFILRDIVTEIYNYMEDEFAPPTKMYMSHEKLCQHLNIEPMDTQKLDLWFKSIGIVKTIK